MIALPYSRLGQRSMPRPYPVSKTGCKRFRYRYESVSSAVSASKVARGSIPTQRSWMQDYCYSESRHGPRGGPGLSPLDYL